MSRFAGVILLGVLVAGCSSYRAVLAKDRSTIAAQEIIYKVELKDGSTVNFEADQMGRAMLQADGLERVRPDGEFEKIPYSEINRIFTKQLTVGSVVGSSLLIGVIGAVVLLVVWGVAWSGFSV